MNLEEITKFFEKNSKQSNIDGWRITAPTAEKVYGVRVSEINKILPECTGGGFPLVRKLWEGGHIEERLLASKILGKICRKDPEETLKILRKFADDISDWPVCDTLATQGIRGIVKSRKDDILKMSEEFVSSENPWKRRFGIVLLINYRNDGSVSDDTRRIIKKVKNDKEHYVKKAVEWAERYFPGES